MKRLIDIEADSYRDGGQSYGKLRVGLGLGQIDRMESQKRDDAVMKTSDLHAAAAAAVRQPSVDVSSLNLELPQLLRDLQELAANPFHAIERNAAGVVVQVFGKFRSRVYLKSLRPPASERDVAELQATAVAEPGVGNADMTVRKEAKDQRSEPSSFALKLVKPRPKPDDTRKAGSKRGPSDRQEPSNEKKMKKTTQVNALALGKKVGIGLKKPEGQQRNQKESSTATIKPSVASARAKNKGEETVKKQEPTSPPLPFSPTALLLKFSLETSLPSVAKLKAMLAVFGPLVKDSTRVYWKSHSCRVVYEHKPHAVAALNYARKSDLLLGPLRCYIRELDPATLKLLSSPAKPQSPKSNSSGGPPLGPGNGGDQPRALPYQQQQAPTSQLKSILKKPGGRVGGGGSAGDAAEQHPQPVTFTGNGRDNWEEPPVLVPAASHGNGGISAAGSSFTITCKNPKSAGLLPLPLLPIHSPLSNTPRAMDELRLLPPPPLPPSISAPPTPRAADGPYPSIPLPLPVPPRGADVPFPSISLPLAPPPRAAASLFPSISLPLAPPPRAAAGLFPSISPPPPLVGGLLPPPLPLPCIVDRFEARGRGPAQFKQSQPQHNGQHAGVEEGEKPDISDQMLILLKRCNNIVNHIHSSLGYLPYHPL